METLRLSRASHRFLKRGVKTLEKIGHELERYNDREERTDDTSNS